MQTDSDSPNPPEQLSLDLDVPAQPPQPVMPPASVSTQDMQAELAMELAAGLLPINNIMTRFDLTKEQLRLLLLNPIFRGMVRSYKQEWLAATNAKERIRVKAAMATEEGLLELNRIFHDSMLNPTARLEAFKQMSNLADVQPKKDAVDTGPKFNLTLNLGSDPNAAAQHVTIDATALPVPTPDPND